MADVPKAVGSETCRGCGADRVTVVCPGCGGTLQVPGRAFNLARLLPAARKIVEYFDGASSVQVDECEEAVQELSEVLEELEVGP